MADPPAVRVRRSRLHRRGDHSLCLPERCPAALAGAEVVAHAGEAPPEPVLGPRGRQLWQDVAEQGPIHPLQAALLLEACRIADRLDQLDAQLRGVEREWLRVETDQGGAVVLVVDKALTEARQQAVALKQLASSLLPSTAQASARTPTKTGTGTGGGGGVTDLTARIAARRQAPAG